MSEAVCGGGGSGPRLTVALEESFRGTSLMMMTQTYLVLAAGAVSAYSETMRKFLSRMIRPVVGGGGPTYLKHKAS